MKSQAPVFTPGTKLATDLNHEIKEVNIPTRAALLVVHLDKCECITAKNPSTAAKKWKPGSEGSALPSLSHRGKWIFCNRD